MDEQYTKSQAERLYHELQGTVITKDNFRLCNECIICKEYYNKTIDDIHACDVQQFLIWQRKIEEAKKFVNELMAFNFMILGNPELYPQEQLLAHFLYDDEYILYCSCNLPFGKIGDQRSLDIYGRNGNEVRFITNYGKSVTIHLPSLGMPPKQKYVIK